MTAAAASATVVVEAATAEEALARVHREHGTAARIIQAEKVLRGGIGGFFAKELVQLTVEPIEAGAAASSAAGNADEMSPIAQALADAAADDDGPPGETFGEMLDRRAAAVRDEAPNAPRSLRGSALGTVSADRMAAFEADDEPSFPMPQTRSDAGAATPLETNPTRGLAGVVADLAAATDHRESTFGDALRAAMVPDTADATLSAPTAAGAAGTATLVRDVTAMGAAALAEQAPQVERAPEQMPVPMEEAEGRLDAAIRAVTAGTTASTVVRAAERGGSTGYVAPQMATDAARETGQGRARLDDLIAKTAAAVAAKEAEAAAVTAAAVAAATPAPTPEATLAPAAVAPSATTAPVRSATPRDTAAPGSIMLDAGPWSEDALRRLGMPDEIVRAVTIQRPTDDLSWFAAVTRALQPLCLELPEGSDIVVGGHAGRYARAAEVKLVTLDQQTPRRGPAAIAAKLSDRSRRWLDRETRGRWMHLVIGGSGWREFLFANPTVVSWTSSDDLPQAITVAAQLDLTLGFSVEDGALVRANAVDLAIALRRMLEQR